jgi:hypothetical protein
MAVRKIALILWVLAAVLALFLVFHFAGTALLVFEKCFATSFAPIGGTTVKLQFF